MTDPVLPSDPAKLSAWLDTELDSTEQSRMNAWLHSHPEDAATLRRWAQDAEALRKLLDPLLDEAPPERLRQSVLQAGPTRRARGPALLFGLVLMSCLAGGLLGRFWPSAAGPASAADTGAAPTAWPGQAALAHALYVPEKRHPVEVELSTTDPALRSTQEEHLRRWLSNRLERPVALYNLQAQEFRLLGGRLLPSSTGPGAQLMYQNDQGLRITLYLHQPVDPAPSAPQYEQVQGLGLFHWIDGGTAYAMAGDLPRDRLLRLVQTVLEQAKPR
jgi:anti-sigma factor RsiW